MSRIDDLIAQYCTHGVKFKALGEVAELQRGTSITKNDIEEGRIPVIAGGQLPAYHHNTSNREGETIVVAGSGAYAGFVSYWAQPIFVSDAFSVKPNTRVLLAKYAFYFLKNHQETLHGLKRGSGVPHVYAKDVAPLRIPVPPLEIQREIVKVLDTFTKLEAELEAELEARRRQYKYYRDTLLTFDERTDSAANIRLKTMGEIGKFIRGRRFTKSDVVEDGIPSIHYGEIYTHYGVSANSTISHIRRDMAQQLRYAQPGDVVIAAVGETVEDVGKAVAWLGTEAVAIHDDCFLFQHTLNSKFVAYYLQTEAFHSQKTKYVASAKMKRLSGESLAKITIPVPPVEEQERIVSILEKFDALVNDLSSGLPAEIKARREQYEHYRDRLLTFREAA